MPYLPTHPRVWGRLGGVGGEGRECDTKGRRSWAPAGGMGWDGMEYMILGLRKRRGKEGKVKKEDTWRESARSC